MFFHRLITSQGEVFQVAYSQAQGILVIEFEGYKRKPLRSQVKDILGESLEEVVVNKELVEAKTIHTTLHTSLSKTKQRLSSSAKPPKLFFDDDTRVWINEHRRNEVK